ncbi:DAK2 domain-containing protein [Nocardia sp. NPDC055321]
MRAAVRAADELAAASVSGRPATATPGARGDGPGAARAEGAVDNRRVAAVVDSPVTTAPDGLAARGVAGAMARAATAGARGNSGIILSQVLRGVADAVSDGPLTAASLRVALRRGAFLVREALSSPVEGTMLTVLDRAAVCADECPGSSLPAVAVAAADGAAEALGETPAQLGVLRQAGVVDAGARGLLVLLDELVRVTGGQVAARPEYVRDAGAAQRAHPAGDGQVAGVAPAPAGPIWGTPHYEVMYLLADTDPDRVRALRDRLGELGDSVVVVGDGDDMWSAHVHCADAGAAVEAGLAAGRLSGIRVETLDSSAHALAGPADRAILVVAAGAGAVRLFEDAGAAVLEGREGEVTADALLSAIRRLPNREVLVLPNGALPAPELLAVSVAARDGYRDVLMLPSGSMVQGLAALSMHDVGRIAVDDAFAMSEAAAGTRWGAVRIAPQRALTMVGTCEAGDGLGLVGHDVVVIDRDVRAAGRTLLDRMLGLGGEFVTMLIGSDAPQGLSEELTEHIAGAFPGVEVVVYPGGQARDLVQIGVE